MNNIVVKDNEALILNNAVNCQIDVNERLNTSIYLCDYQGDKLTINVSSNTIVKVLYFTKEKSNNHININVSNYSTLNFDVILMNDNTNLDLDVEVDGEGVNVNVNTLSLAKECEKNINININHRAKESTSNVCNYGISFDNGINRFKTVGKIHRNMKNSDVRQITRGLLLSPTGACLAEPILLIDYFDVKAYHGATIGKINDDDLFYLMSRGLTQNEAFMLVINGLVEPFVKGLSNDSIKAKILSAYEDYFRGE